MRIERLDIQNFRVFDYTSAVFAPGINFVVGANGQGKTSLLEAVSLFAFGRSMRARKNSEMIRFGTPVAQARVQVSRAGGSVDLAMRISPAGKQVFVNRVAQSSLTDLLGKLHAVLFTPDDLQIVKGGPDTRRSFMNLAVSPCEARFTTALQTYNRLLRERNVLLKRRQLQTLPVWDESLSSAGAEVTLYRRRFMRELAVKAQEQYLDLSGGEMLQVEYRPFDASEDLESLSSALYGLLREHSEQDVARGHTSVGPHRDDLALSINGASAAVFASQGQQRTAVLALKIALVNHLFDLTGEYPVLLLDDVLSELDENRRERLFSLIEKTQTILTGTRIPSGHRAAIPVAKVFQISRGIMVEGGRDHG